MSQGEVIHRAVMQRKVSDPTADPRPVEAGGNNTDLEEVNESKIQILHNWIQRLCDPEINFSASLNRYLPQDWDKQSEIGQEDDLSLRVGQISISGLSEQTHLDDISEENEIGEAPSRVVNIRKSDGTIFEGHYSHGKP